MRIRNRIALLIVAMFILGTGSIAAYQSKPKAVTITDNGKVTQYETIEVLVGEFLAVEKIELEQKDKISVDKNSKVEDEMEIEIARWNPNITLNLNGDVIETNTKAYTVNELIEEQGITLSEKFTLNHPGAAEVVEGLELIVKTESTSVETRQADLPFTTKVEMTSELEPGVTKVKQEGKIGRVERDFEVLSFGGSVKGETQIRSHILEQPVNRIVLEGKKKEVKKVVNNAITCPTTGKTYAYKRAMNMEATAYSDVPGDRWYGKTASGMPTFIGMIAVDPRVIPLGTKVYVEGYGIAHAGDTGGAIKGNIIDLFMENRQQTRAHGRRQRKVYILEDQSLDVRAERRS